MKQLDISIERPGELLSVAKALSSEVRIGILRLLSECSMSVVEMAERLHMPVSTVSTGIAQLEAVGIINSERQSGIRGSLKLCSRRVDVVTMDLGCGQRSALESSYMRMPIGHYADCQIEPVCGLANCQHRIAFEDEPSSFYDVERTTAQILWFRRGFIEYRFSSQCVRHRTVRALEVSFEACSEAPNYRNDWPSDITVWLCGAELGTWTCPGDFGGRRGTLNPDWWPDASTQYGMLKRWRVDETGTYLDEALISPVTIADLRLKERPYLSFRLGVKAESPNQGGINLFGEQFGDYPQAIVLRVDCLNTESDGKEEQP